MYRTAIINGKDARGSKKPRGANEADKSAGPYHCRAARGLFLYLVIRSHFHNSAEEARSVLGHAMIKSDIPAIIEKFQKCLPWFRTAAAGWTDETLESMIYNRIGYMYAWPGYKNPSGPEEPCNRKTAWFRYLDLFDATYTAESVVSEEEWRSQFNQWRKMLRLKPV